MTKKTPFFKGFTMHHVGKSPSIITKIGISFPGVVSDITKINFDFNALWDTGATNCSITNKAVITLGLKPIGTAKVNHAGGTTIANEYLVNLYLPNKIIVPNIRVTGCEDTLGHFDVLIGMNIITTGDFAITNFDNKTVASFRIPSIKKIDFVEDFKRLNQRNLLAPDPSIKKKKEPTKFKKKPSKNVICPCGSGKLYKHCCGK